MSTALLPPAPAPSPFYEGTSVQWAWSSTSLGLLKTCARKYYYVMVRGLRGKGDSPHLRFGGVFHKALEVYDRQRAIGADHDEATREALKVTLTMTWDVPVDEAGFPAGPGAPWTPDHNLKTRRNLVRSVIWYLEKWQHDPAKTIILASGAPAVELSFQAPIGDGLVLVGHLDRLVEFSGGYFVMDRKTTTTTPGNYYFDKFEPDNQMSLYTLAGRLCYQTPVRGVIIDAVQIMVGGTQFERGLTYRTEGQLEEWLDTTRRWIALAHTYAHSEMGEAQAWPMNDTACHDYGGCPFRRVCSRDPQVREAILANDFVADYAYNPLEIR